MFEEAAVETMNPQQAGKYDEGLLVKFFLKPRQDKEASQREGRPIFKDVEYIDIKIPGSRIDGASRPATPEDKQRFAKHYAAFKQRVSDDELQEGTPLSEWGMVSRSMLEELAFFNVRTVEQLAGMSDANCGKWMGVRKLRDEAKVWLENAKDNRDKLELRGEINEVRQQNQRLQEINAALEARLNALEQAADTPRRGRPKKVDANADHDA